MMMYALVAQAGREHLQGDGFINENQRFKARHPATLRRATYASLLLWLLIFLSSPLYLPTPYSLPDDVIEILEIPAEIKVPERPKDIPRPQLPVAPAPDPLVREEFEFVENIGDWDEPFHLVGPGSGPALDPDFIAFDTKPSILHWASPDYPETARDMELAGIVLVDVLVGTDGRAKAVQLAHGIHPILDGESLEAALRCVFSPGRQRDTPVEVWVTLPFRFSLRQ